MNKDVHKKVGTAKKLESMGYPTTVKTACSWVQLSNLSHSQAWQKATKIADFTHLMPLEGVTLACIIKKSDTRFRLVWIFMTLNDYTHFTVNRFFGVILYKIEWRQLRNVSSMQTIAQLDSISWMYICAQKTEIVHFETVSEICVFRRFDPPRSCLRPSQRLLWSIVLIQKKLESLS